MENGYDYSARVGEARQYYERLRQLDAQRDNLVEVLIQNWDESAQNSAKYHMDLDREKTYNRDGQIREAQLKKEIHDLKVAMERNQFVLVLIDGDGMIFEDSLLRDGEAGGKQAAGKLWTAIRENIQQNPLLQEMTSDFKIVARIYANEKGLGDVCYKSGITSSALTIGDFSRGFTGSKSLFDFVDVGSGKDRADEKISEQFRMNLENVHCRHIFLGCSHDNGYARLLEEVSEHPNRRQITLLEGVPFERELLAATSHFATTRFDDMFKTTKINYYAPYTNSSQNGQIMHPPGLQQMPLRSISENGHQDANNPANGDQSSEPPSGTSISIDGNVNTPMNWANRVGSAPPQRSPPPPTPQATHGTIPRNKYGQRIDKLTSFEPAEWKRIQRMKICNNHFLRNDCPNGDHCTHDHSFKANKNELALLGQIARSSPCKFRTECDDYECIYGHRCPHSVEGSKQCKFGNKCRFEPDMHVSDLKIVRTTKVT